MPARSACTRAHVAGVLSAAAARSALQAALWLLKRLCAAVYWLAALQAVRLRGVPRHPNERSPKWLPVGVIIKQLLSVAQLLQPKWIAC
jgi:hypothetical protein